jgi:ABC-type bacteriocin/lantibiotic exporter with double-glycine peptidase domain
MSVNDTSVTSPQHAHVIWTLFDYLLSEMGSSAHEKGMRHDLKLSESYIFKSLADTAISLGLKVSELMVNIEQAVESSGNLIPLIRPMPNGDWLVLSGFRRGRIKVALIKGTEVEIRLLRISSLVELLKTEPDRLLEWYSVELRAPMDASAHQDDHHLLPLHRLFEIMKVEKTDLWRVALLAVASGLLSLATPVAVQSLVNTVALGGMIQPLLVLSIMLFIFLSFFGAVSVLQSYIVELLQRRVFVRMASDLAYRLPKVKWDVYDQKNGAELVNRFFDVLTVQKAGALLLLEGFSMALQSGIGLLVLAAYHPLLMIFDLIVIAWLAGVIFIQGRKGTTTSIQESAAKYSVVAWLETLARNGQTFKFSGGPELAREHTDRLAYDYFNARRRHYRILLKQHISLYALYAVASTTLLAVGGMLVMDGQLSLGQLIAAEIIVSGVLLSFSKLKKQLESYYDLMAGVDKLGHLLDLPVEQESGEFVVISKPIALAVHDLTFNYPNHSVQLQALNFDIKPGEKVAVFGELGSGKSTLADLLTGLRLPSEGRVEVDQIDISELRLDSLRKHIAVLGNTEMIEDSILENIRLGRPEISVAEVRSILKRLNLMFELDHIPEGIYTQLSLSGSPLSTTQIRKLLIARAIAGNPKLIIVDSLLDEWQHFSTSDAREILFDPEAPWTLLVLTSSRKITDYCQRTIELPSISS